METRTLQEVLEVKELILEQSNLRIDRVMLDNMTTLDKSHEGAHALWSLHPSRALLMHVFIAAVYIKAIAGAL